MLSIKRLNVGEIVSVKEFTIRNDVGGTSLINKKSLDSNNTQVRITKTWYDYETGEHAEGQLIDKEIIEKIRTIGQTDYLPENYKQYGEDVYQKAKQSKKDYNPTIVHFSEFDLEEEYEFE